MDSKFRVGFSADFLDENGQFVFPDFGLRRFENQPGLEYAFLPEYLAEYAPEQLSEYDVIISLKPRVSAGSLDGVTRLCAIGRCGVGYDNVDLRACTEHDVAVYITPGGVVRPMAESIVLLVLAVSHNLVRKDRLVRQGKWSESTRPLGREPRGRVIGSIGCGNIAREALRLIQAFQPARVLAFDPYVSSESLTGTGIELTGLVELLRESDYVLVNCPLNDDTRGMIGAKELGLMKADAYLINTARGLIVNQDALIEALRGRRIAGAALDVFEKEPLPADSALLTLDNVILTSHSIGWTEELFRDMGRIDCEGAVSIMQGNPPATVVNREVLDRPGFRRKLESNRERARRAG